MIQQKAIKSAFAGKLQSSQSHFLKLFVETNMRLRRFKIMDISKKIGSYFEKNYQAGRKIIWKVLLKSMQIF